MPEGIGYSDAAARGAASQPTQRPSSQSGVMLDPAKTRKSVDQAKLKHREWRLG